METSLRLILLLVGIAIVAGIIWDITRVKRKRSANAEHRLNRRSERMIQDEKIDLTDSDPDADLEEAINSLEEVVIIKTPKRVEAMIETPKTSTSKVTRVEPIKPTPTPIGEVIALSVMARQPGVFLGKKLLDALVEAQLIYGDRDIFHRFENRDGSGNVIFSLASAVEPGTFDLSRMETFVTPGLMLFFTTSTPNQSIAAFELMLRTARQLASRLDGELRDDRRRLMTVQGIENYRERVRLLKFSARAS